MKCNWLVTSTCAFFLSSYAAAATLSDNLSSTVAGTEPVSGNTWVAAEFSTDASTYTLSSATLMLQNFTPGTATLYLYRDAAGQPGTTEGNLSSPGTYSTTISATTFAGNNLLLLPNSNYWLVLTANTGDFEWAWTESSSGSGAGFEANWSASNDAGATWFTSSTEPEISSVMASPTASAVPEPSVVGLLAIGYLLAAGFAKVSHRA